MTLPDAQREQLKAWMLASQTSDTKFRAALPTGWTSADKTGTGMYGTNNDVGILYRPDGSPIMLAVLSDIRSGGPDASVQDELIASAAATVIAHFGA